MKLINHRVFISLKKDFRAIFGLFFLLLIVFSVCFAPFLTNHFPRQMELSNRLCVPQVAHWLGCDLNGMDVWSALLYGGRVSLGIAFSVILISLVVGVFLGIMSGFFGGWLDHVLMRIVDVLLAFPGILLALTLASVLGPSFKSLVISISVTGWVGFARLVRGQVIGLKEREFVQSARALGAPISRLILKHLMPSLVPILIVHGTFSLSGVILVESSLSFLGLGPQGGVPTWGSLLSQGKTVLTQAPHLTLAPGIAIFIIVMSLNFLGDAFRDAFDPKN